MLEISTKVDGADSYSAGEFNSSNDELKNLITGSGQTLSGGDLAQIGKAVAAYAAMGEYYTDSGTPNSYTLSTIDSFQAPETLINGQQIRFIADNENTGASTVNVAGVGAKDLLSITGAPLAAGEIVEDRITTATYILAFDAFFAEPVISKKVNANNYITNPSMAVSQEYGDGPNTATATELFGADEWNSVNDTATGTLTVERGELQGYKSYKVTATSAITNLSGALDAGRIQQRMEGVNIFNLNSKTVTLTFTCKTNWTGDLSITWLGNNDSRSYVTKVPVISGVNFLTSTLTLESSTVAAPSTDSQLRLFIGLCNEGSQATSTEDAWQAGVFLANSNATQWVKTTGNYVEITAVGLYEGTTAPDFQPNTFEQDLAACQRYFDIIATPSAGVLSSGQTGAGTTTFNSSLSVPLRITPSVTTVGSYSFRQASSDQAITVISSTGITNSLVYFTGTIANIGNGISGTIWSPSGASLVLNSRL